MSRDVNTPHLSVRIAALLLFNVIVFPVVLQGRVGETQDTLEKRLLRPGLGKLLPRPADSAKDKDRPRKKDEDPLKDMRSFFPDERREMFYWKSAVADHLSNETGWKVDVFYVSGHSALEAYKRVGETLNEFEVKGILSANRGNSSWRKTSKEGGGVNGIGYDYELEDGSLRAKQTDGWLIVFSTKLDNHVVQQQVIAKAASDAARDALKHDQALKAPESLAGF